MSNDASCTGHFSIAVCSSEYNTVQVDLQSSTIDR